jgi:hypothetical protein
VKKPPGFAASAVLWEVFAGCARLPLSRRGREPKVKEIGALRLHVFQCSTALLHCNISSSHRCSVKNRFPSEMAHFSKFHSQYFCVFSFFRILLIKISKPESMQFFSESAIFSSASKRHEKPCCQAIYSGLPHALCRKRSANGLQH